MNDFAQKVSNPSFLNSQTVATQPTMHRSSGIDIIYEDRRLQLLLRASCAQLATSAGTIPTYVTLFQPLLHLQAVTTSTFNFAQPWPPHHRRSEDDTKKSFDSTNELKKLNDCLRTCSVANLRYDFDPQIDAPPVPKVPSLQAELEHAGDMMFEGNHMTPSYVAFSDTERLIGDATKDSLILPGIVRPLIKTPWNPLFSVDMSARARGDEGQEWWWGFFDVHPFRIVKCRVCNPVSSTTRNH
ncbi:hypothetical protein M405DRAFT_846482 [Rhizopogon salebrosus TDB-379]|nr:hypothetical protein M405DRAFT_846482 [Rhizopogon salebrosus TDB-379]